MFQKQSRTVKTLAMILCMTILTTMLPLQSFAQEAGEEAQPAPLIDSLDPTDSKEPESRILEELPEKRDAYSKRFVTENKSEIAAVYSVPVHYEKDGEWEEIDNTLVWDEEEKVYRNAASDLEVAFAEKSDAEEPVSIQKGGYEISWELKEEESPAEEKAEAGWDLFSMLFSQMEEDPSGTSSGEEPLEPIPENKEEERTEQRISEFRVQSQEEPMLMAAAVVEEPESPKEIEADGLSLELTENNAENELQYTVTDKNDTKYLFAR